MAKYVVVKTQFEAFHRYVNAPECVKFLRSFHRHIFFVKVYVEISADREVEFFMLKKEIDNFIEDNFSSRKMDLSCEAMAEEILTYFRADMVGVYEDNENGSEVYK